MHVLLPAAACSCRAAITRAHLSSRRVDFRQTHFEKLDKHYIVAAEPPVARPCWIGERGNPLLFSCADGAGLEECDGRTAGVARRSLSIGRDLGRARRQFRALFGHAEKVELCLFDRTGQQEQARIVCQNTPTRCGTAICPRRGRVSFTATAFTVPTTRRRDTASIPTSC